MGKGRKIIPFESTLSFNVLERSSSFLSWMDNFSNLWIRRSMIFYCFWEWFLFLNSYLGSLGTLVFLCWDNSPSASHLSIHCFISNDAYVHANIHSHNISSSLHQHSMPSTPHLEILHPLNSLLLWVLMLHHRSSWYRGPTLWWFFHL